MNKIIELRCAREGKDNVGMLAGLAMHSGKVDKNSKLMCACKVMRNSMVLAVLAMNNLEQVLLVNNVNNLEQVLLMNMEKVKNKVLAVLAMLDVTREDDITPRLNRTHREESEDGVKKMELDKETGNTLEEGIMNVEKVNAFNSKDTNENEDYDRESIKEKDAEGVSDREIKNSSGEEAGFKDT
jgi:hypothetical protein